VTKQAFLAWFVVVGGNQKCTINAEFFCLFGGRNCFPRRIRPRPSKNETALVRGFNGATNHLFAFVMGQRGRFARGSNGNDTVDASRDLGFD